MEHTEPYFSLVKTGASSWSAVLVNAGEPAAAGCTESTAAAQETSVSRCDGVAVAASTAQTERIPRLAVAMVTFLIFAVGLSVELERLRQVGFFLR